MNNIDWNEVEYKISLILYKFDNLSRWHEDLAQELRIHAYYVSDDYYDLYRKAIDFWRQIQTRQIPETPYFDLEILGKSSVDDKYRYDQFDYLVQLIRKELNRPGYNKKDNEMLQIASQLLDMIIKDIDDRKSSKGARDKTDTPHYWNNRLSLVWAAEETGIGYKRLANAMKFLEDTVRGLAAMKKIELPDQYFKGYYEE